MSSRGSWNSDDDNVDDNVDDEDDGRSECEMYD